MLEFRYMKAFIFGLLVALMCFLPGQAQTAANAATDDSAIKAKTTAQVQAPDDVTNKITDLVHGGKYAEAQQLTSGLLLAYPNDQRLIRAKALLDKLVAPADSAKPTPSSNAPAESVSQPSAGKAADQLTGMDKVEYNSLIELGREAQQTTDLDQQKKVLHDFMDRSSPFLKKHPDELLLWQLRAASAISLDDPAAGYEAGQKLLAAGAADSKDPNLQHLLARLHLKGWLDQQFPAKQLAASVAQERSKAEAILTEAVAQTNYKTNESPKVGGFTPEGFVVTDNKGGLHTFRYAEIKTFEIFQAKSMCFVVLKGDPPGKFPFPWHWWHGDTDWPFWSAGKATGDNRCPFAQKFAEALKTLSALAKQGASLQRTSFELMERSASPSK
jgi:hypothetical protein